MPSFNRKEETKRKTFLQALRSLRKPLRSLRLIIDNQRKEKEENAKGAKLGA